jgi:WD40 repeat protein
LWRVAVDEQQEVLSAANFDSVGMIAFSADDSTLVAGDYSKFPGFNAGDVQLWNLATGLPAGPALIPSYISTEGVTTIAVSADEREIASDNGNGRADLWTATAHGYTDRILSVANPVEQPGPVAFSPDGKLLVIADGRLVEVFDTKTGHKAGPAIQLPQSAVYSLAFSPDGRVLATGDGAGAIRLWSLADPRRAGTAIRDASGGTIQSLAFSPDGTMLAAGDSTGRVQLWNLATHSQIGSTIVTNGVLASIAFSPDGQTLATGTDNGAQLWDVGTQQQIGTTIAPGGVGAVAFSPDGRTLATGSDTVTLWDVSYLQDPLSRLCAQAGGSITRTEWASYIPAGPSYHNVCP